MTTDQPAASLLPATFSRADYYHLAVCRGAWLSTMRAYRQDHGQQFMQCVHLLAYALGIPEESALARVKQVGDALTPFPMPAEATHADNDPIWHLFLQLVLFVQADDDRVADCAKELGRLTNYEPSVRWWLARARAYAPLGLPLGTRL